MKTKTYDQQTAKFIAVLTQNIPDLSGQAMQSWIENPKGLKIILTSVLCPTNKKEAFEKLITIKLGTGPKNAYEFFSAFLNQGIKMRHWARKILNHKDFIVSREKKELDLVSIATFKLGFKVCARRGEIYKRAKDLGLELCPIEVGAQLVLQYGGQYVGEWIAVAMEPVIFPDGTQEILSVIRDEHNMALCAHGGQPEHLWHPQQQWVFVLPRK